MIAFIGKRYTQTGKFSPSRALAMICSHVVTSSELLLGGDTVALGSLELKFGPNGVNTLVDSLKISVELLPTLRRQFGNTVEYQHAQDGRQKLLDRLLPLIEAFKTNVDRTLYDPPIFRDLECLLKTKGEKLLEVGLR